MNLHRAIALITVFSFVGLFACSSESSGRPASSEQSITPSSTSEQPITRSSTSSSAVEGAGANWLLVEQLDKHKQTVKALADAKERGDFGAFKRILRLRSIELAQAIGKVETGSYSISDKQKLLNVLQQEKDWADSSIAALSQ